MIPLSIINKKYKMKFVYFNFEDTLVIVLINEYTNYYATNLTFTVNNHDTRHPRLCTPFRPT